MEEIPQDDLLCFLVILPVPWPAFRGRECGLEAGPFPQQATGAARQSCGDSVRSAKNSSRWGNRIPGPKGRCPTSVNSFRNPRGWRNEPAILWRGGAGRSAPINLPDRLRSTGRAWRGRLVPEPRGASAVPVVGGWLSGAAEVCCRVPVSRRLRHAPPKWGSSDGRRQRVDSPRGEPRNEHCRGRPAERT